tara:strand:+ start:414 stop:998 length:585 start_codon:yes stop_codon:yes gene_type:complete
MSDQTQGAVAPNSLTSKFSRTYIYLNPEPFLGPYTQRISNIPPVDEPAVYIENLYTFAPMQHTETNTTANLFFNFDGVADINDPPFRSDFPKVVRNVVNNSPYKSVHEFAGIQGITGIAPVDSIQRDKDVALWFDFESIPNVDTARSKQRISVTFNVPYNRRSIESITATAPIYVNTVDENASVTFDITSLPDA